MPAAGATITSLDYDLQTQAGQTSTTVRLYTAATAALGTSLFSDTITSTVGSTTPMLGTISSTTLTANQTNPTITANTLTYYVDTLATPIPLVAGTYYVDGDTPAGTGTVATEGYFISQAVGTTLSPAISSVSATDVYSSTSTVPTTGNGNPNGDYNVNFDATPGIVAIPEPASISVLAAGAGILLGRRRRRMV